MVFPLNRKKGCVDGNPALLLLTVKIGDSILVSDLSHSRRNACEVAHSLSQRRLTCTAMAEQDNVSDLVCGINLHVVVLQLLLRVTGTPKLLPHAMNTFY